MDFMIIAQRFIAGYGGPTVVPFSPVGTAELIPLGYGYRGSIGEYKRYRVAKDPGGEHDDA